MEKEDIKYYLISCLILLPSIFFPISADHSAFIQGGRVLSDGGMIYADFIDLKPPLIYYLFSLFELVAAENTIVYRIFDFFFQCTFLFLVVKIIRSKVENKKVIQIFLILYALCYVVLNDRNTMQVETFMVIPLLFYLSYSKLNRSHVIVRGIMLGLLLGLKFTFGLVILAIPVYFLFNTDVSLKTVLKYSIVEFTISLSTLVIIFLPVIINESAITNYSYVLDFLKEYATDDYSSGSFIKTTFKSIGYFFGYLFSISFSFLLFYSIIEKRNQSKIWYLLAYTGFFLFITVIIESEYSHYHFARTYFPLIFLASSGFIFLKDYLKGVRYLKKYLLIILFIIFSPIPRYVYSLTVPYYYFTNTSLYLERYNGKPGVNIKDQIDSFEYIEAQNSNAKVLMVNTGGDHGSTFIYDKVNSKFAHSGFYLEENAPEIWKKEAIKEIKNSDYLILGRNDIFPGFFTMNKSSEDLLKQRNYFQSTFSEFHLDTNLNNSFAIYKRR